MDKSPVPGVTEFVFGKTLPWDLKTCASSLLLHGDKQGIRYCTYEKVCR